MSRNRYLVAFSLGAILVLLVSLMWRQPSGGLDERQALAHHPEVLPVVRFVQAIRSADYEALPSLFVDGKTRKWVIELARRRQPANRTEAERLTTIASGEVRYTALQRMGDRVEVGIAASTSTDQLRLMFFIVRERSGLWLIEEIGDPER